MIINVSRWKAWRLCKRKAFNVYHRGLEGQRSMNLVDGGAFHRGVAVGRATHIWDNGRAAAKEMFEQDVAKSSIPPEQAFLVEEHWKLVEKMIGCFEKQYEHETYQILQPECEFDVALPHSEHNCVFLHWYKGNQEIWRPPTAEEILGGEVTPAHPYGYYPNCRCAVPHRFVGKTDAIVAWNQNIWLDEYKTSSIGGDQFWDQWFLDNQPTAYIYGIWKQLKVRPRGFLLNALMKPSEAQVANWNSKRKYGADKGVVDYVNLEREAFLRTEEDLWRVERQLAQCCYEWEREITDNQAPDKFSMTPTNTSCKSFNRKCDFFFACQEHESPASMEALSRRERDYVDEKLVQIKEAK